MFETWATPGDLLLSGPGMLAGAARTPRPLGGFHQIGRSGAVKLLEHGDDTVTGFVKYDPTAAAHITTNQLFSTARLQTYLPAGHIPDFPNTAISLKPVFVTLSASKAIGGHYFRLASWPGPPPTAQPFPTTAWKQCIWVDVEDPGDGPGTTFDATCAADGSSRKPASTYGLGRFINFRLSANEAATRNALIKALDPVRAAKLTPSVAGDHAILVAMHMTSRETKRWTWATFFWSPTPDAPLAPSSTLIASVRPSQLTGAGRQYAHCTANLMESPPQPDTGGTNVGNSVYCYNPWLEAGFGPGDLPDSQPGKFQGKSVQNNVGIQTNCMSCHAQANFNPSNLATAPNYTGDRYVDLAAPAFKGTVSVDLLWSIPGNAK